MLLLAWPPRCEAWDLWASSPWLALIARFIGGVYVEVHSIKEWNEAGLQVRRIRNSGIPRDGKILAMDSREAIELGMSGNQWIFLATLYSAVPFDMDRPDYHFSDPSILPFVAQRVLNVLTRFDPGNYPFFQRRLSELQTRLDSTIFVGRQLLKGYPVHDLTGGFSRLLEAAGCSVIRPNGERWKALERGEGLDRLLPEVEESLKNRIPVVVDATSPKAILALLKGNRDVLAIGRPAPEQDILLYFYDQYLLLWNKLAPLRQQRGDIPAKR